MDNKPNALIYTKEKLVHGNDLFGEVLNHLQNIKAKCNDNPQAKKVIKQMQTCSWGCLCEVNSFYEDVYNNDEDDEDEEEDDDDEEEEEEEEEEENVLKSLSLSLSLSLSVSEDDENDEDEDEEYVFCTLDLEFAIVDL